MGGLRFPIGEMELVGEKLRVVPGAPAQEAHARVSDPWGGVLHGIHGPGGEGLRCGGGGWVDPEILEVIRTAKRYPEGRGVRLEVRAQADLEGVRALVGLKVAY